MFLERLIHQYINDQWVNYRNALNYPQAREAMLGCGKLYFFEKNTSRPKYVFQDEELEAFLPIPLLADANGVFQEFFLPSNAESTYRIEVRNEDDDILAAVDCGAGFKI